MNRSNQKYNGWNELLCPAKSEYQIVRGPSCSYPRSRVGHQNRPLYLRRTVKIERHVDQLSSFSSLLPRFTAAIPTYRNTRRAQAAPLHGASHIEKLQQVSQSDPRVSMGYLSLFMQYNGGRKKNSHLNLACHRRGWGWKCNQ